MTMSPKTPKSTVARSVKTGRFQRGHSGNPAGRKPKIRPPSVVQPPGAAEVAPHTKAAIERLWELALQSANMGAAVQATRQLREHYLALESLVEKPTMTVMTASDDLTRICAFIQERAEGLGIAEESALELAGVLLRGEHGARPLYSVFEGARIVPAGDGPQ